MFRIQEYLVHLEKNAKHQVGATATEFAVISAKKTLTRVLKLEEPYNYYGIKQINKVFVSETINTTFDGHDDRNIKTIYDTLMRRNEKFCILHTTSKLKIVHANIMTKLRSMYSNMTIFTYNGNGSFLMCDNEYDIDNLFKWCKGSQIKRKIDSRGKYLYISKSIKLGDIMSEISSHKRICIISGHLASRGLSFVSNDYSLHLTDQYYNPSKNVHGEALLQGIRLFGCYNDNPNLVLWITKYNWSQIKEQHRLLGLYIEKVKNSNCIKESMEKIETIFPNKLLSRPGIMSGIHRGVTKDGYMKLKITDMYDYNNINNETINE